MALKTQQDITQANHFNGRMFAAPSRPDGIVINSLAPGRYWWNLT